jgi:glyoxylase-like metal-dependent hydrolase (beta-lactamase superfamily II)
VPKTIPLDSRHGPYRIYPIRGLIGYCHLLYDESRHEAVLIDTGLVGEIQKVWRVLGGISLGWRAIRAILLTHGHLDHVGNLASLKQLTGATVLAHPSEQPHINGTFPYRGASRVCGNLEAIGRALLRYEPVAIDEPLHAGMELPYWGGLRVVHLPGHTQGHCGFYSAACDVLFSGDLFASYVFLTHLPPSFLNSCPELFGTSLARIEELSPRRIVPNHYFGFDGEMHRKKFDSHLARWKRRQSQPPDFKSVSRAS